MRSAKLRSHSRGAYIRSAGTARLRDDDPPAQAQTFTDLYDFNAGAGDPTVFNSGRLAQGRDGNFYAESQAGGTSNAGTVFKITTTGTLTIRHSFDGTDGASPDGGMSLGLDGSLYGDATRGGSSNQGTAIKITPSGTFTVLHNFTDPGAGPFNALVQGTNGSFYGTTNITSPGATIYSVTSTGTFATVHTLTASEGYEGGQLSIGNDGNIYRAMNLGGTNGFGTAFKMTPGGVFTVLHNFTGTDGANAAGGMVQAFNGKFYGAASNGGSSNAGVIYSLTSSGTFTVLHILNGTTDGFDPMGKSLWPPTATCTAPPIAAATQGVAPSSKSPRQEVTAWSTTSTEPMLATLRNS